MHWPEPIFKPLYSHFKGTCQIESVLTSPSLIPWRVVFIKPNNSALGSFREWTGRSRDLSLENSCLPINSLKLPLHFQWIDLPQKSINDCEWDHLLAAWPVLSTLWG